MEELVTSYLFLLNLSCVALLYTGKTIQLLGKAYQFPIWPSIILSLLSGLLSFQYGSYRTKNEIHKLREKRINQGWSTSNKTELKIIQKRKRRSSKEKPMMINHKMKLMPVIARAIK